MIKRALCALLLPFAGPALAEGFFVDLPIDCDLTGPHCYIQQYMDHDPGTGSRDYRCQGLSYDGHKGTDFALPTRADMQRGVAVVAAAPGTVIRVRDGIPDSTDADAAARTPADRACGNGVVLTHTDGWETQYCHLRHGSVTVRRGDTVETGAPLGLVGQSGRADFPHVHFSVRKDGTKIDPFAPAGARNCAPAKSLWTDPPAYRPGGLISIGLSAKVPDYKAVKAGTASSTTALSTQTPTLALYGYAFGIRKGDVMTFTLTGPTKTYIDQSMKLRRTRALSYRAIGETRRRPWPAGTYTGTVTLLRDGAPIDSRTVTHDLTP